LPVSKVGCLTEIEGKIYAGLIRYGFVIINDSKLEVENVMQLPREANLTENTDTHMSVTSIVAENGNLLINCLDDGILRVNDSEEVTLVKRIHQYAFSKLKTCDDKIFLILDPIGEGGIEMLSYERGSFIPRKDLTFTLEKNQYMVGSFFKSESFLVYGVYGKGIVFVNSFRQEIRIPDLKKILSKRPSSIYDLYFDGEYFWIGTPRDGAYMIPRDIMMEYVAKAKPIPIPREYWHEKE